jgi:hypothetical protein
MRKKIRKLSFIPDSDSANYVLLLKGSDVPSCSLPGMGGRKVEREREKGKERRGRGRESRVHFHDLSSIQVLLVSKENRIANKIKTHTTTVYQP